MPYFFPLFFLFLFHSFLSFFFVLIYFFRLLVGEGARKFGESSGVVLLEKSNLVTEKAKQVFYSILFCLFLLLIYLFVCYILFPGHL